MDMCSLNSNTQVCPAARKTQNITEAAEFSASFILDLSFPFTKKIVSDSTWTDDTYLLSCAGPNSSSSLKLKLKQSDSMVCAVIYGNNQYSVVQSYL